MTKVDTNPRGRLRGQPLVVLAALLVGWSGARIAALGSDSGISLPEAVLTVGTAEAAPAEIEPARYYSGPQSFAGTGFAIVPMVQPSGQVQYVPLWSGGGPPARQRQPAYASGAMPPEFYARDEYPPDRPVPAAHHAEPPLAGALLPLGAHKPRYGEPMALLGGKLGRLIGNPARWSADAWALLREEVRSVPAAGTLPATYGGSQAGAVLRYRLAMHDPRKPTAYLRTTSTIGGLNEVTAALGLSARPFPAVPIVAGVEGRITDQGGSRRVQPAVLAVTEMPAVALPGALRAELYAQGGYVGGRYATPFADGQLRVDRELLTIGRAEARVGAGAWGGIQKGASRLDAGPGATISMPLSPKVFGRMALDWRFRVAGDAEPGSGPALTVAAGF